MKATTLLSAIGYAKAPRATFFLKHPVRAVTALMAYRAAKKAAPRRMKTAMAVGAAAATAVVAPMAVKALRSDTKT